MEQPVSAPIPAASPPELARFTAVQLVSGYRSGAFTPREAMDEIIATLERIDAVCNVVVTDLYEQARAEADRISSAYQSGSELGPLAGVPVTIKDLVFVKGVAAKAGAPSLKDYVPDTDAFVVQRLRQAGAIVICKTTTCESGYKLTADSPLTGITRNPWDPGRTSGGSSGGAAAAVAAGGGPIAIGTDGVGSIRVPSSFCGVFGLKPTFGRVSRAPGFFPPSWGSLAHTGPISRSVEDAAIMLGVIAGYDARDAASLSIPYQDDRHPVEWVKTLKIGISPDLGYAAVDPDVRAAFENAVKAFSDLGAQLVEADLAIDSNILEDVLQPIAFSEQAASVGERAEEDFAGSDPEFRAVLAKGREYTGVDYVEATHRRNRLRAQFVQLFTGVDFLITPTVATTAFGAGDIGVDSIDGRRVEDHLGWSPFTWPINLTGLPATTVPCGFDRAGLPIGLQIVAPWFNESGLLSVASAFESAKPWREVWPTLGDG